MSETTNYQLYYDDDPTAAVKTWVEKMGGSDSNMTKLDTILYEKAGHSVIVYATLSASGWSGVDSPFTYELEVDGLGAEQNGNIDVAHDATFEQRQMAREAQLCITGQSDGKLIISADGEMPDIDIPVFIVLID